MSHPSKDQPPPPPIVDGSAPYYPEPNQGAYPIYPNYPSQYPSPQQGYQVAPPPPPPPVILSHPQQYQAVNMVAGVFISSYESVVVTCTHCGNTGSTNIVRTVSALQFLVCFILIISGCILGCCLIPFCIRPWMDTNHYCSSCGHYLGRKSVLMR